MNPRAVSITKPHVSIYLVMNFFISVWFIINVFNKFVYMNVFLTFEFKINLNSILFCSWRRFYLIGLGLFDFEVRKSIMISLYFLKSLETLL